MAFAICCGAQWFVRHGGSAEYGFDGITTRYRLRLAVETAIPARNPASRSATEAAGSGSIRFALRAIEAGIAAFHTPTAPEACHLGIA